MKFLLKSHAYFSIGLYVYVLLIYRSSLYVLDISLLLVINVTLGIFCHIEMLIFIKSGLTVIFYGFWVFLCKAFSTSL